MPGVEHIPIRWARPSVIVREQGQMQPHVVVDHIMQGYLSTMVDWASNGGSKVIAHFGIGMAGRVVQFSDIYTEGIHVTHISNPASRRVQQIGNIGGRGANPYSIGIEHEGCSVDPRPAYTVPPSLIYSRSNPWPKPMVDASIKVKQWIFTQPGTQLGAPSRDSIIGHYEVDRQNRINDPASQADRSVWPVARMLAELATQQQKEDPVSNAYIVQPGDTLWAISRKPGFPTPQQLVDWNGIKDPALIRRGQVLRLDPNVIPPAAATGEDMRDLQEIETLAKRVRERLEAD